MKEITALLEEAVEHRDIIKDMVRTKSDGLQFAVMQVGTTRMQYSGFINPQQGVLSKMLFTTDRPTTTFKSTKAKEKFLAGGVRTAVDELSKFNEPLLKQMFTDAELQSMHTASDKQLIELAKTGAGRIKKDISMSVDDMIRNSNT